MSFHLPLQMTVGCKSFQSIRQLNNGSFIIFADNCSFMDGSNSKCILQSIPGIFFKLLMA